MQRTLDSHKVLLERICQGNLLEAVDKVGLELVRIGDKIILDQKVLVDVGLYFSKFSWCLVKSCTFLQELQSFFDDNYQIVVFGVHVLVFRGKHHPPLKEGYDVKLTTA